jgi:hypothetical protein
MYRAVGGFAARFLILWFPFFMAASAFGQEADSASREPSPAPEATVPTPEAAVPATAAASAVPDAVLEGIQVSSEPSKESGSDVTVTCYFIFRDKPSSYFYEVKRKTNKLVFEFNDAQKGTSPIPSQKASPIEGFELDQHKVDVNREVKGLNPELHDQVSVSFSLSAIPKIHVSDEYNVISFSFKWSTDPAKLKTLVDNAGQTNWGLVGGLAGGGAVVLGAALYYLLKPPPPPPVAGALDTSDLPSHSQKMWR